MARWLPTPGDHWIFESRSTWTGRALLGSAGPENLAREEMERESERYHESGWRVVHASPDRIVFAHRRTNERRMISVDSCPGIPQCEGCRAATMRREATNGAVR